MDPPHCWSQAAPSNTPQGEKADGSLRSPTPKQITAGQSGSCPFRGFSLAIALPGLQHETIDPPLISALKESSSASRWVEDRRSAVQVAAERCLVPRNQHSRVSQHIPPFHAPQKAILPRNKTTKQNVSGHSHAIMPLRRCTDL